MLSYFDLFRNVAACYLNKIESLSDQSKRVKDLFRPKAVQTRDKIKQQCESLLLDDSLRNGKKAIEILWKYCYHCFMQHYKRHKKTIKTDEYNLLVSHFQSGTGHFYSILLKLANDFGDSTDLNRCVPELVLDNFEEDDQQQRKKKPDSYTLSIAGQCIHRILICLGDLYRYLDNLGKDDCRQLATKWYNAAILFDRDHGMPFNQLGSLAGTDNYNLDSVYYYIRCLSCRKPFDNAEDNLKFIFNTSKGLMKELAFQDNSECVLLVKKCLIEFIHLVNLFWLETDDFGQLEQFIGTTLNTFNQAIQLKTKPTNARKPTYLCPETVFQFTVIIIILNQKFKTGSLQGDKLHTTLNSATIGFALNFLFYLVNATIKQTKEKNVVEKAISGKEINRSNGVKENGYVKKSSLFKLRRKANFRMSNECEDSLFNMLDEEDDDLNELEETALSTIDALEMSSDMSETGSYCDNSEDESTNSFLTTSDDDGSSQHNSNNSSNNNNNISATYEIGRFLAHLYNESMLPSIKSLTDWLTVNENLFNTYHQAFDTLFANLVELLNLLLELEEKALKSNPILNKFKYTSYNWKQTYPLSIDISVSNLDTFKDYQKKILDLDHQLNCSLTEEESGFLCVQSIIAFGHRISGNLSKYKIEYNSTTEKFCLADKNQVLSNGYDSLFNEQKVNETILENGFDFGCPTFMRNNFSLIGDFAEQMNNDIIPNVAHLWLEDKPTVRENGFEVNAKTLATANQSKMNSKHTSSTLFSNENSSQSMNNHSGNKFLPYLLLDDTAFSDYLELTKELFNSREFMIVVPKIILQELGKKQRNSYESKDAIKWIKHERQKSTKFLRLLKSDERLRINNIMYPKKEEKTAHDFHVILEYLNHLNRKSIAKYTENGFRTGLNDKIILLYGKNSLFPVNYEELLDKIGVRSESISSFVKKYRLSSANGKNG